MIKWHTFISLEEQCEPQSWMHPYCIPTTKLQGGTHTANTELVTSVTRIGRVKVFVHPSTENSYYIRSFRLQVERNSQPVLVEGSTASVSPSSTWPLWGYLQFEQDRGARCHTKLHINHWGTKTKWANYSNCVSLLLYEANTKTRTRNCNNTITYLRRCLNPVVECGWSSKISSTQCRF